MNLYVVKGFVLLCCYRQDFLVHFFSFSRALFVFVFVLSFCLTSVCVLFSCLKKPSPRTRKEMLAVESCSSDEVGDHTVHNMLQGGTWIVSDCARASFVVRLDPPSIVKNIFVRNSGSGTVEIDGLCNLQWVCLRGTAQLIPDAKVPDRLFKGRFFEHDLSLPLKDCVFEKLRVTVTPREGSLLFGLAAFRVNLTESDRDEMRAAGPGLAPKHLADLGGADEVVPVAFEVRGKEPKKAAPKKPDESKKENKTTKREKEDEGNGEEVFVCLLFFLLLLNCPIRNCCSGRQKGQVICKGTCSEKECKKGKGW